MKDNFLYMEHFDDNNFFTIKKLKDMFNNYNWKSL